MDLFVALTSVLCASVCLQTVKRPRKVPVNLVNRPSSPDDRVFNNDYNDDYNYDQDRRSVYSGRDHSPERERGGGYMDSGYQTHERDHDRDYDRRDRGRNPERDLSPDRPYRREGSRGRTLDKERSPERPYRNDKPLDREYSPDRRYRSERTLDREHSPERRYRSERALDRESPDHRFRNEKTLDRNHSPYRRDSPGRGHGRDHSFERGRDRIPSDPRKYDEPVRRSGSRDRLDRSPSPAAMPIPLPRPARDLEPLEKPLNVLLLKKRPNEGEIHLTGFLLKGFRTVRCDIQCVACIALCVCFTIFSRVRSSSGQPALHQGDDQHWTRQQRREPAGGRHHTEGI